MATYVVYPGNGLTAPGGILTYIDAASLAALYGLSPGEYDVGQLPANGSPMDFTHIHLVPRPDGLYRNIKTELGDNGTDFHFDKMVGADDWRRRNNDYDVKRYRS